MIPYHLHCWDMQTLLRSMHKTQGWSERHHVEVGIALREETALQTSVDATHIGFLAKQLDIRLLDDALQVAMAAHLPGRIAIRVFHLGTSQSKASLDGSTHIVEVRHHVRTLRRHDIDSALGGLNAGDIAAGLNHSVQGRVLTNGVDAVVDSLQGKDEVAGYGILDDGLSIGRLHGPYHLRIGHMELVLYIGGKDIPVGLDILLQSIGNGDNKHAVARNGVVHLA